VKPSNRRVKPPQLPPDVWAEADIGDVPVLVDPEPEPNVPAEGTKPPSRAAQVARAVVGVAVFVSVMWGVAWAARRHVVSSSRFAVTEIDVSGQHRRTTEEITKEAGIAVGANIFSLDLDRARARALADPWIKDLTLARRLPGTIFIRVTEREAAALVALGDTYLATSEGELFKKLEPGDPVELPVVTGLRAESVAEDREGAMRSVRRAIDLASEYEHGPLGKRAPLEEINAGPAGTMTLIIGKNALALVMGEPPYRKKLDQAARVLAELDKRGAKADAIMLDNEARPDRVVVRMR
jgi:cell division protein FtsQ